MPLTSELRVIFSAIETGSNDFGGPVFKPLVDKILPFANGNGANQANILFADRRTLAAEATEDIDLAGALSSAFGATITAASVVAVMVIASASNTNNVVIGNGTHPITLFGGTTPTFSVKPGGLFVTAAPGVGGLAAVTAGTGDDIAITNSGAGSSVTYDILILGRTS